MNVVFLFPIVYYCYILIFSIKNDISYTNSICSVDTFLIMVLTCYTYYIFSKFPLWKLILILRFVCYKTMEEEMMSFYDLFIADGEVLGALVTVLLIVGPMIIAHLIDKRKNKNHAD